MELFFAGLVSFVALVPLFLGTSRLSRARWLIVAAAVLAGGWRSALWRNEVHGRHTAVVQLAESLPRHVNDDGYVSADNCRACHPQQYDSWHHSYHRTMTQAALGDNVVGDFNDVQLEAFGGTLQLQKRGETYWARITPFSNPTGAFDQQVVMATGSHHQQAYWALLGDRLVTFPFTWIRETGQWVPKDTVFTAPEERGGEQLGLWDSECIRCHSTHGQPPWRVGDGKAQVAELGISCEACHGPAAEHLRLSRSPLQRYAWHLNGNDDRSVADEAAIVNPGKIDALRSSEVCGRCHSLALEPWDFRPGDDLHEVAQMYRPREPGNWERYKHMFSDDAGQQEFLDMRYWGDGIVRVSGREYTAMLESKCYQGEQLSCLTCHSMHNYADRDDQLRADLKDDQTCLKCHEPIGRDIATHTHHPPGSSGSQCYNCHMPHTSYGLLKGVRSHYISSPTVEESLSVGRPNACNQCHLDRPLGWTQDWLVKWYGHSEATLPEEHQRISATALWLLKGDAGLRALAAWTLGWDEAKEASAPGWLAPYLVQLLEDPYPSVRYIALRSLRRLPGFEDLVYNHVGRPEERAAGVARARKILQTQTATAAPASEDLSAVLLDPDGQLDRDAFRQFLLQRDDRKVILAE